MSLVIPIIKQSEIFKQHLDNLQNERIIFSGIFGIGKSYFLKRYFYAGNNDYLAINLKPINYSISQNEDIFKLVKYDILYELMFTHELELVVESVCRNKAYGVALGDKIPNLIESFLPIIPLLNKEAPDFSPLLGIIKKITPFINEVEKSRKDLNNNFKLEEFVKEIEKGHFFESDFITEFIEKSLESLSVDNQEAKKTKVLIIDDLDRIDPEHIFRLFNVFSAHFDYNRTSTNKFGFDKVVFVCDVENIRNIFAAKYGVNTDFSGYIDKFYSTGIFYFNNNEEVARITEEIIKSINFHPYTTLIQRNILHDDEGSTTNFLYIILKACINSGSLNMRRIQAIYKGKFNFEERQLFLSEDYQKIYNKNIPVTLIYDILLWVFGDIKSLESALERLVKFGRSGKQVDDIKSNPNTRSYLEMLLPILDYENHKFRQKNGGEDSKNKLQIKLNSKSVNLEYDLTYSHDTGLLVYDADIDRTTYKENVKIELYEFVLEAFNTLKAIDYFK
jgi:hypothetical protein